MAKKWGNAGEAFIKAGDLHLKNGSRHDGATNFVDAANCYKKSEPKGIYGLWIGGVSNVLSFN
jgi:alpha-soluble NSF attachment protein